MCMLRQWHSLSMFHKTSENMHGGVELGELSMPCNIIIIAHSTNTELTTQN